MKKTLTNLHKTPYTTWIGLLLLFLLSNCREDKITTLEAKKCADLPVATDVYVYPVLPGTQEWIAIPTVAERVLACQIPEEKLLTMSTRGLIGSWVTFPFALDIHFTSSTYQHGMSYWMENFSGLQELCKRSDADTELLDYYDRMQPTCVATNASSYPVGLLSFTFIELLLAQDVILNQFNLQQKKALVKEALEKFQYKKQDPEYFGTTDKCTLLICARTMENTNYQPFTSKLQGDNSANLTNFLTSGQLVVNNSNDEITTILSHARNFIR